MIILRVFTWVQIYVTVVTVHGVVGERDTDSDQGGSA